MYISNFIKMLSLDIVLADDIALAFPTTFSFTTFTISYAVAPSQPNGYDCGLLLCMFMYDNCPTPVQMKSVCYPNYLIAVFTTAE